MPKLERGKEFLKSLADFHSGRESKHFMNEARRTQRMGQAYKHDPAFKATMDSNVKRLKNKARRSQRMAKNLRRSEAVAGGTAALGAGGYAAYRHREGKSNEST